MAEVRLEGKGGAVEGDRLAADERHQVDAKLERLEIGHALEERMKRELELVVHDGGLAAGTLTSGGLFHACLRQCSSRPFTK